MRRVVPLVLVVLAFLGAAPAGAAQPLDDAAQALRRDPVYVDPSAERALTEEEAESLRDRISEADTPIFVAVLPGTLASSADDAEQVAQSLAESTGLAGTYAVVVGDYFRALSTESTAVDELATAAFQANRDDGAAAVLEDFVARVAADASDGAVDGAAPDGASGSDDGGTSWVPWAIAGAGGVGVLVWAGRRRGRQRAAAQAEFESDRMLLRSELSVLADDVLRLEPLVLTHPEARSDYDAAVSRYRVVEAALDYADEPVDLVRVGRVLTEARYAMSRAQAIVEGREPPPPPPELRQPGRHDEPPIELDPDGQPVYAGYGPFYGGGWFGGGGGLLSGLLLGSVLGGWGWGGPGWGWGGHGGGSDGGSSDGGGFGGGDFGGGDFGGGDFGGGDFGGGDW